MLEEEEKSVLIQWEGEEEVAEEEKSVLILGEGKEEKGDKERKDGEIQE